MKLCKKKRIENLVTTPFREKDYDTKEYAEFSFKLDDVPVSFEVSKNLRGFGTEPFNHKDISDTDAKRVLRKFKKRRKNNEDDENFEINA